MQPTIDTRSYAYIARCRNSKLDFKSISNDRWEIVVLSDRDDVGLQFRGVRMIDDTLVNVWYSVHNYCYLAQKKF